MQTPAQRSPSRRDRGLYGRHVSIAGQRPHACAAGDDGQLHPRGGLTDACALAGTATVAHRLWAARGLTVVRTEYSEQSLHTAEFFDMLTCTSCWTIATAGIWPPREGGVAPGRSRRPGGRRGWRRPCAGSDPDGPCGVRVAVETAKPTPARS